MYILWIQYIDKCCCGTVWIGFLYLQNKDLFWAHGFLDVVVAVIIIIVIVIIIIIISSIPFLS